MRKSQISWTEYNLPYSTGCTPASEGCKNCWAREMSEHMKRMGQKLWENGFEFTIHPEVLDEPNHIIQPSTFFVCPSSDLFHEKMKFEDIDKLMGCVIRNPRHTFQILTKRAPRMAEYFSTHTCPDNVWLGVTVENANHIDRIDILAGIDCMNRWVSFEPLIGPIGNVPCADKIRWWVVGGENANSFPRPMKEEWVLDLKRQADAANATFYFKQWGSVGVDGVKRSVKTNGHLLQGKEYLEIPELVKRQPKVIFQSEKPVNIKCKKSVKVLIGVDDIDAAVELFEEAYREFAENEYDITKTYCDYVDNELHIAFSSISIPEELDGEEIGRYLEAHIDKGEDWFSLCCNTDEDIIERDGVNYYVFTPKINGLTGTCNYNYDEMFDFINDWLESFINNL